MKTSKKSNGTKLLLYCVSLFFIGVGFSHPALPKSNEKSLDSLFVQWGNINSPGIAVAVMQNGIPIYKKCVGCNNLEEGVTIKSDSVFQIASTSKQLTAFCIAMLINQGLITSQGAVKKTKKLTWMCFRTKNILPLGYEREKNNYSQVGTH